MSLPILFPNVPNLPGVPQLARSAAFPPTPAPGLGDSAAQGKLWQSSNAGRGWGIFDSKGKKVIDADTILNFDNRNERRVSDFPVQDGAFASYNKVTVPFETSVRVAKAGSTTDRKNFLAQIDTVLDSLELYTILTPEKSYSNCNMTRSEVTRRGVNGAFFLSEVDLYFRQIRSVTAQYSSTGANTSKAKDPTAFDPVNGGLVQPLTTADFATLGGAAASSDFPF